MVVDLSSGAQRNERSAGGGRDQRQTHIAGDAASELVAPVPEIARAPVLRRARASATSAMYRRRCAHKVEVEDDAGPADGDGDDVLEVVLDVLRGKLGCGACVCGRAKAGSVRVGAAPLERDAVARDEDGAVDVVAPGRPGVGGRPGARARARRRGCG